MTQPMQEASHQPAPNMPRVSLDDFIEAVTLGVRRAMEAEGDVAGYALQPSVQTALPNLTGGPPIFIGIIYNPGNQIAAANAQ